MSDLSNIYEINDEAVLKEMLSKIDDIDERKIIRNRLLEIKTQKSKERAQVQAEHEKRMNDEILERKERKENENADNLKRLDELAKSGSTSDRLQTDSSKKREDYLKEKQHLAQEERKKEIDLSKNMSKLTTKSATPPTKPNAFAIFQNKDKEAGGTGKASSGSMPKSSSVTNPNSIKDNLLRWCQIKTEGYPNVSIQNFSSSWADGLAFCALIHSHLPSAFDFKELNPKNRRGNFELAFKVAEEKADISPLLDVEDMLLMGNKPDWKCVFTYVQTFYRKFELEPKMKADKEAQQQQQQKEEDKSLNL